MFLLFVCAAFVLCFDSFVFFNIMHILYISVIRIKHNLWKLMCQLITLLLLFSNTGTHTSSRIHAHAENHMHTKSNGTTRCFK